MKEDTEYDTPKLCLLKMGKNDFRIPVLTRDYRSTCQLVLGIAA